MDRDKRVFFDNLRSALHTGHFAQVDTLLLGCPDVNALRCPSTGEPLLFVVSCTPDVVEWFVHKYGADVNVRDTRGHTLLSTPYHLLHANQIRAFLRLGVDVHASAPGCPAPVWLRARHGWAAETRALLVAGARLRDAQTGYNHRMDVDRRHTGHQNELLMRGILATYQYRAEMCERTVVALLALARRRHAQLSRDTGMLLARAVWRTRRWVQWNVA